MNYTIKKYKDGQISAKIEGEGDLLVNIRGNSYEDLFQVAAIKDAWDANRLRHKFHTSTLNIYCLIGQRSDRRFHENESFDLRIIAKFINGLNFDQVNILHPHSDTALALIENSQCISHYEFVAKAYRSIGSPVLISPDAGAYKESHALAVKLRAQLIPANKVRVDGKPNLIIQGNVAGLDCLIVDDLADGGRTFIALAKELKKQGAQKVYLYVTHGQFSFGFEELKENIEHIFCTNSFRLIKDAFVTQYEVFK